MGGNIVVQYWVMSEGRKAVDITTLGLPELEQIRDGLNEDIEKIQVGLNSLNQATHGYILSKDAADSVRPENEGTDILVPMTSSLFVPGKMGNSETVMLDIGAGFYVQQTPEKAKEYFDRRASAVREQMNSLENTLKQKKAGQEQIIMVMQQKIAAISQDQAQTGLSGLKLSD